MDLFHANQNYAVIRLIEGREFTVSALEILNPTLAGPGKANEFQSLLHSNKIAFSTLDSKNSTLARIIIVERMI